MVRVVVKTAKGPKEIKPQKHSVWVCMCGLSKNAPFCDQSHKKTLDEKDDQIYVYNPVTGERSIEEDDDCCGAEEPAGGCCGGKGECGSHKKHEHGN